MRYLIFEEISSPQNNKGSFVIDLISRIILLIFPSANPNYDNEIHNAIYWLLEFDEEDTEYGDIPNREIGLDDNCKPILKMPYKKNYGYWLDTNMTYSDFIETFNAKSVDASYFNEKWNELS